MLAQAQFLAALTGIIGIEHHRDIFSGIFLRDSFGVTTGIEFFEIELIRGCRFPQSQRIDRIVAVAGNRNIIGNRKHVTAANPKYAIDAVLIDDSLGAPAEMNNLCELLTLQFPGVAVPKPVIGVFHLEAIFDVLTEHAIFVTNAVTDNRKLKSGTTVHETGGQTAETAIPQAGVGLTIHDIFQS